MNSKDEALVVRRRKRTALVEEIRTALAGTLDQVGDVGESASEDGLHVAACGWFDIRDEIERLLARVRKMPK